MKSGLIQSPLFLHVLIIRRRMMFVKSISGGVFVFAPGYYCYPLGMADGRRSGRRGKTRSRWTARIVDVVWRSGTTWCRVM